MTARAAVAVTAARAAGLAACSPEPTPLPAAEAQRAAARDTPLYQLLYAAPLADDPAAQRVRALAFLRHLDLDQSQLDRLDALRALAEAQAERLADAERRQAARREAAEITEALWAKLASGAAPDDPEIAALTDQLRGAADGRDRELVALRLESARVVLEASHELLSALAPEQEDRLLDGLFVLRRRLDPVGTPGDFDALIGAPYEPGANAVLARGTAEDLQGPLDIAGLWSDAAGAEAFPDAKREVILFLLLTEPGLGEAIEAARGLQP